jgi:cell division protein FtsI (penicillin-binding protein 3)
MNSPTSFRPSAIAKNKKPDKIVLFLGRRRLILNAFIIIIATLLCRAIYLQVMHTQFLQNQGDARYLRTQTIAANRGVLTDRNGEPLAVSTPVDSVWINPKQFVNAREQWESLATVLNMPLKELKNFVTNRLNRGFVYLKRHLPPSTAEQIKALKIQGVFFEREYHRYYPAAETTAHVLGFTNVDNQGQEGLELALESSLKPIYGEKQVIQDKYGNVLIDVKNVRIARDGESTRLSIDRRLQYLAHRELEKTVKMARAKAGSVIILDVKTGEVLAMVNQPSYNPNDSSERESSRYRNRAVADVFEPGSTMKPFTIASALESGKYSPHTFVNTSPGKIQFGRYTVRDGHNYGRIDLTTVVQKSSNVGASKIALSLPAEQLWKTFNAMGFGSSSNSGFPGELRGRLPHYLKWRTVENASLSFGYGLNVTLLQLARAYAAFGNKGILPTIRFTAVDSDSKGNVQKPSLPAVRPETAQQIVQMMETVVKKGGTAVKAAIEGYSVAGKTGTVRKHVNGKYSNAYLALFVGIAPSQNPRLVVAVMIDTPRNGYYGGQVAAPLFAEIMSNALRFLNVPFDITPVITPVKNKKKK